MAMIFLSCAIDGHHLTGGMLTPLGREHGSMRTPKHARAADRVSMPPAGPTMLPNLPDFIVVEHDRFRANSVRFRK